MAHILALAFLFIDGESQRIVWRRRTLAALMHFDLQSHVVRGVGVKDGVLFGDCVRLISRDLFFKGVLLGMESCVALSLKQRLKCSKPMNKKAFQILARILLCRC